MSVLIAVNKSNRVEIMTDSRNNAPNTWKLQGSNDGNTWVDEDSRSGQSGWARSEKRTFTLTDTGTADAWRYWRLNISAVNGDSEPAFSELELFPEIAIIKATFNNGALTMNASALDSLAKAKKEALH
jgi:hypothetical protein